MSTLQELVGLNMLNECAIECTKQSRWKETTQRYMSNMLINNMSLRNDVLNNIYKISKTTDFWLNERGKMRWIEAPVTRDRVIQKSLMKNVLIPRLRPYIIYDNYASLKNRGTAFARMRFEIMLHRYISKHGTDGYVLLGDFRKYFESVDHTTLKGLIAPRLKNEPKEVIDLIYYTIDNSSNTAKGLNLGGEPPQIFAVYFLTPIDNYVKIVKGVKYYGHYMDDFWAIGRSKSELSRLLSDIEAKAKDLNIGINKKKTHIIKLRHGFTYLQIKYNILPTGKILTRPTHNKITRERHRLKAFKRLYDKGVLKGYDVLNCYRSWRGTMIREHNHCHKTILNMDALFKKLFPDCGTYIRKKRSEVAKEIWKGAETRDIYCLIF